MATGRLGAGDTAIQPTILDAKGDLIVATAADTPARLAVGATNGHALLVDSSTATGLKWGAVGKVLQVVSTTYAVATTVTTTSYVDTGLSLAITPSATSSKILVLVDLNLQSTAPSTGFNVYGAIYRGVTNIYDTHLMEMGVGNATSTNLGARANLIYLDSPSTTSSTTYKVQFGLGGSGTSRSATAQYVSKPSSITLLEIGA